MRAPLPRLPLALLVLLLRICGDVALTAAPQPAPLFGSHMVLQRDLPLPIWGRAEPGEAITVTFAGQSVTTRADDNGNWRLTLAPLPSAAAGRDLVIHGLDTLVLTDVCVGEVWFASGQSNMEKPVGPRRGQKPTEHHELVLAAAHEPRLRFFQVPRSDQAQDHPAKLRWLTSSPDTLRDSDFSAAAYAFGRDLAGALGNVPIGIIHASFGGTRIEAWMPASAFDADPTLHSARDQTYHAWVPGVQPTELFASMIAPYAGFAVRGFLWYQGETNLMSADVALYPAKQRALIHAWRAAWNRPDAAFYFALLAPFDYSRRDNFPARLTPEALPAFWQAQQATLDLPGTDFISTTDLVANRRDIHPINKRDVGHRFALLALRHTYGFEALTASGPRYAAHAVDAEGAVAVTFEHAEGLHRRDGRPLEGFELAGADRRFHAAEAGIEKNQVIVRSPDVSAPVALRYAWHELADPNLVNGAGLPAVPFRTDNWPVVLERTADAAAPVAGD